MRHEGGHLAGGGKVIVFVDKGLEVDFRIHEVDFRIREVDFWIQEVDFWVHERGVEEGVVQELLR